MILLKFLEKGSRVAQGSPTLIYCISMGIVEIRTSNVHSIRELYLVVMAR